MYQFLSAGQEDLSKEFASNAEKGNAHVIVTVTSCALVLIEGTNPGIPYICGTYSSFLPVGVKDFMKQRQKDILKFLIRSGEIPSLPGTFRRQGF